MNHNQTGESPMTRPRPTLLVAAAAYMLAVFLANWLTSHYGQWHAWGGMKVTAGTYAAGAALLARDFLQRYARAQYGRARGIGLTITLILLAGLLSWISATGTDRIILASTVAFLVAELVDLAVFTPVRDRWGFIPGALLSNVVSAPVDTVLFLWISGFGVTVSAVSGQFIAKVLWATAVPLTIWALITRRRQPETLWDQVNADLGR